MSVNIAAAIPERVIAAAPVCLEVGPKNEVSNAIPMVTIFGERDGKQMEKLAAKLPIARKANAQWAIAVQWGRKHEFHKANNLIMPFFDAVIQKRYPELLNPKEGPPKLLPFPDDASWLGAKDDWGESPAEIRPWVNLTREFAEKTTCWFPDADFAATWQAFVVKRPKLKIKSPPGLGGGQKLIIHPAGKSISVEVAVPDDVEWKRLAIHRGARRIATNNSEQATFTVDELKAGIHPLIAVGIDKDGKLHRSEPHTLLVR